ncbi:MAG: class I SAM-dependent methyltransferase [Coleofasciculus sp. A1-SPW-01]|uniref:class I SAM-dependent methyltransferase n=1 Tax=Coleofasciculus sp. A1-SPW-01 TaxID=3070819 RepID=UPI0032FD3C63
MNTLLEQIYKTSKVEDAEGKKINPFPTATPQDVAIILQEQVKKYNAQNTLEIGMAYGLSTLAICQAHHEKGTGSHTAIDPSQSKSWKSIGLLNIKRAGLEDRFRFIESPSYTALPQLLVAEEKFDFAFIDGNHLFDYALLDFFYIDKLLQVGGYIMFDDLWMPSVRKAVSFVLRNRAYKLVKIKTDASFSLRFYRIIRRISQTPINVETRLKFIPNNVCLVQKIANDKRRWDFHHSF